MEADPSQVIKKFAELKDESPITQETIQQLKEGVNKIIEAQPQEAGNDQLLETINKSLKIQLAMLEKMQTVRDECRENINTLKAQMESIEGKLDVGAEDRRNLGEPGRRLQEFEKEIRERVGAMNAKLDDLDIQIEESLAEQLANFQMFKDDIDQRINEPQYRCRNIKCKAELGRYLPVRVDGVSVECTRPKCRQLNIVANVKEGQKWMQTKCGKIHFQKRSLRQPEGVKAKCRICGSVETIWDAHNYMARPIDE